MQSVLLLALFLLCFALEWRYAITKLNHYRQLTTTTATTSPSSAPTAHDKRTTTFHLISQPSVWRTRLIVGFGFLYEIL